MFHNCKVSADTIIVGDGSAAKQQNSIRGPEPSLESKLPNSNKYGAMLAVQSSNAMQEALNAIRQYVNAWLAIRKQNDGKPPLKYHPAGYSLLKMQQLKAFVDEHGEEAMDNDVCGLVHDCMRTHQGKHPKGAAGGPPYKELLAQAFTDRQLPYGMNLGLCGSNVSAPSKPSSNTGVPSETTPLVCLADCV